jgi:hypothetical protein
MTSFKTRLVALACCVVLAAPVLAQSDIAGIWEVTLNTPQGPAVIDASFKQEGEAITGTVVSPMGSVDFKGTFVKDALTITYALPVQGQTLAITMTGTLADEKLSGTIDMGGIAQLPWTARRKPPSATTSAATPTSPAAAASPVAPDASGDVSSPASGAGGKWDIVLNLGQAQVPLTAVLTQEGEKVTGTLSSAAGEVPVTGTMIGSALKLEFTAPMPQGQLPVTMTGDLGVDGFTGEATISGMGEANWTATRAKQ